MRKVTNRKRPLLDGKHTARPLKVRIRVKSTVPKNIHGRFFDTTPEVWTRRRLCPRCKIRACVIPALVEHVIFPHGGCRHCICWDPHRHCCWCGVSHHGARIVTTYDDYIKRLIELGCLFCQDCNQYVSIPHALHPMMNPKPKVTNRKPEVIHGVVGTMARPDKVRDTRRKPNVRPPEPASKGRGQRKASPRRRK